MEAQKEGKVGGPGRVREGVLRPAHAAQHAKKWRNKEKAIERKKRNGKKGRARGHSGIWSAIDYSLQTLYGTQYRPRFAWSR